MRTAAGSTDGLSVIVVTFNSVDVLPGLLESLEIALAQVPRHEVVVVDNASGDDSADVARAWRGGAVVVDAGRNGGYAAGINQGLAARRLDGHVLVLNPDVELRPGCLPSLLGALREQGTGIVVPRILDDAGRLSTSLRRDPSVLRAWAESLLGGVRAATAGLGEVVSDPARYAKAHRVDWATGAVMLLSRDCAEAVGPWDESFFLYSEEVDYCLRARAEGFTVRYEPDAVAVHCSGPYGEAAPRLWGLVVANRIELYRRRHGPLATTAFRVGVALGQALRAPRRRSARVGLMRSLTSQRAAVDAVTARSGTTDAQQRGFVWFAAQDWWYHNQAHSDFQLMKAAAGTRTVLVVNSIGLRLPRPGVSSNPGRRILRKLRSTAKLVRRPLPDLPRFHVMTPVILPFYGDTPAARVSAGLVRLQVRLVASVLGLGARPHIGVTIPTAWPVVAPMARASLLYNRADLHSAFPEADGQWLTGLEEQLMRHADRVLYVSRELLDADGYRVGARALFLDHGVDLDHFHPDGPESGELAAVPHPRVGFFGGFDDYVVDMPLLLAVAQQLPEHHLVLVGDATCDMGPLIALPNVHWFGKRPYAQIPCFGRGFDVGLMPWLDNEWIRFANPIKMKEYLALGLPVVSTDFPEVRHYEAHITVARPRDRFVELVRQATEEPGDPAARRRSVLEYSWTARGAVLLAAADAIAAGSSRGAGPGRGR